MCRSKFGIPRSTCFSEKPFADWNFTSASLSTTNGVIFSSWQRSDVSIPLSEVARLVPGLGVDLGFFEKAHVTVGHENVLMPTWPQCSQQSSVINNVPIP